MTSVLRLLAAAGIGVLAAVSTAALAAAADPVEDACQRGVTFLCHFFPVAPHLEGDVDLTRELPPPDPAAPDPEMSRPSDYY